jgi:hypothetical protein
MEDGKDLQAAGPEHHEAVENPQDTAKPGDQGAEASRKNELAAKQTGNEPDIKPAAKNNFAAVFLPATDKEKSEGKTGEVVRFTDQEAAVLRAFLKTQNYEETAKDVGIKTESAKRILRRPNIKRYLSEMIARAAINEGTDLRWYIKELRLAWEGERKLDPLKLQAMKQLGDVLKPHSTPGVQVNLQHNSYYGGLSKEATNAEWTDARATAT